VPLKATTSPRKGSRHGKRKPVAEGGPQTSVPPDLGESATGSAVARLPLPPEIWRVPLPGRRSPTSAAPGTLRVPLTGQDVGSHRTSVPKELWLSFRYVLEGPVFPAQRIETSSARNSR